MRRSRYDDGEQSQRRSEYVLRNSVIRLEDGPAGAVARIERGSTVEYAGPLPPGTVDALAEVADG